MDMEKVYEPQKFESDIYAQWLEKGYFTPEINRDKKPFTIVIPPPNITGQLHMGHALDNAVQDCLIRYKRMQGYCALWLPGTDHASIATELKIVEQLKKDGLDKQDVGRERFLELAWEWKEKYGGRIVEQLKRLGSSCDWSREAFTLDEKRSKAVRHVFKKLYDKGLIYQGDRITNWCPECGTALSDAEVDYCEHSSHLWHFKYFTDDGRSITFATTRPETMLGDTAVAVNPDDGRYADFVGHTVKVPFVNRTIPIIADSYVEKDFGTGVVKITPAHDPNDFEVGLRHNLEILRVMNDDGTMNEKAGSMFEGLTREEARKKVVAEMDKLGQLVKIEDYTHNVGECYRCKTTVEPVVSKQWFVKMKPLAERAIKCVRDGEVNFVPARFEKIYFNWMENIRDWCISRQLWWGHRIPVWYCQNCGETICEEETPRVCPHCGSERLRQDEDVLDTWFSSALWPFSTLGWPEETEELKFFFPTDVLVTAYDIIFFWVARMIFSSLEHMDAPPFKDVLIHGIVRDKEGRKMSKSLGNGVDPLEFIDAYGADTLRFSLLNGVASGGDIRFSDDKVKSTRNFMNKIWNASRFVLMNIEGAALKPLSQCSLSLADKWILTKLNRVTGEVNENFAKYELGIASVIIYDFVWSEFCDWYIEFTKPVLNGGDEEAKIAAASTLNYCLDAVLKLLHPFVPFITEQIYKNMPVHSETIMLEKYPEKTDSIEFEQEAELTEKLKELVAKLRNLRAEMGVPPSKKIRLFVKTADDGVKTTGLFIQRLTNAESVTFTDRFDEAQKTVSVICSAGEVRVPLGDMVDTEKELLRLKKEMENADAEINRVKGKLSNPGFVAKAPAQLVEAEKRKLSEFEQLKAKLSARMKDLTD